MPITGKSGKSSTEMYAGTPIAHRGAPDCATDNIGSMTPQGRSPTSSHGRRGRGGYEHPDGFTPGDNGAIGIGYQVPDNPYEGYDREVNFGGGNPDYYPDGSGEI